MELQAANTKLKAALASVKETESDLTVQTGGNGILNNLPPAENGHALRPESHLGGAIHFLKNKYDSNNMHIPHQNDDAEAINSAERKEIGCGESDGISFYETFGYLSFMAVVFLSIITAISLFGRFYGGKNNPGLVDGLCFTSSSASGPVLNGRVGLGNHRKDSVHVV